MGHASLSEIEKLEQIQLRRDMNISYVIQDDENVIVYYNFLFILYAVKSIASIFHSFFVIVYS